MCALSIAAILLFLYPFLFYPALLPALPRRKLRADRGEADADELPSVALVICALNEQNIIGRKIENSLALRYPADKLSIVVVSDGSTDRTADIAREFASARIELIERRTRRGKIANLNEILPARREEILALSDANVLYDPDALLFLVSRFRDPSIGCVSGKVILTETNPVLGSPTNHYYSIEWFLQERASEIYSMAGADGAMYALRRGLFRPCPDDTLIEDFAIPMGVARRGGRVVFEPRALGWERGPASLREEFRRKARIAAGAAQALIRGNGWPRNAPAEFWFVFLSHKLLRWLSPLSGALALVLAALSFERPLSRAMLAAFAAAAALALLHCLTRWKHPVLTAPFYFLLGQSALALGLLKGVAGRQTVLWAKENR